MAMKNCNMFLSFVILYLWILGKIYANECGISPSLEQYAIYNSNRMLSGEYSKEQNWPWIVSILSLENGGSSLSICTGTIISKEWILTAAHCIRKNNTIHAIHYGSVNISTAEKIIATKTFSYFDNKNVSHDIALIKLSKPLEFNEKVFPICLNQNVTSFKGEILVGAGFGNVLKQILTNETELNLQKPGIIEYEKDSHQNLRESPMANIGQCEGENPEVSNRTICIGGVNTGPLEGDSGGPLMAIRNGKWIQLGIASRGGVSNVDKISAQSTGVYTKINFYCDWIQKTTNGSISC